MPVAAGCVCLEKGRRVYYPALSSDTLQNIWKTETPRN